MTRFRRDYISARAASLVQRSDLASSGCIPNDSKSHWDPVQVGNGWGSSSTLFNPRFKFQKPSQLKKNVL